MIKDPRNRQLLQRSIDAMRQIADSYLESTRIIAANDVYNRSTDWPERLVKVARISAKAEHILGELHQLLDQPPGLGGAQQLRALPDPPGQLDGQPQSGLAVAAAGDSGSAAA